MFASEPFKCALSWSPRVGKGLRDVLDSSAEAKGATKWKFNDPNKKISSSGAKVICRFSDRISSRMNIKIRVETRVEPLNLHSIRTQ